MDPLFEEVTIEEGKLNPSLSRGEGQWSWRGLSLLLFLALSNVVAMAQGTERHANSCFAQEERSRTWKVEIDASASVRCPELALAAGQGIRLAPDSESTVSLDVFVYSVATNELAGKSDDEAAEAFYEWRAVEPGAYYVVLRNGGERGGSATLRVVPAEGNKNAGRVGAPNQAVVNVYYATDRAIVGQTNKGATYGPEPAADDSFSLGIAAVSIPRSHKMGELEGPSIIRLEFSENPEKHVVLLSATPEDPDHFYRRISDRISQSPHREAFVFVHGFNVTFDEAVRRTAQMAYDLGFDGAPILYSWPSHGRVDVVGYNQDIRNAELSVAHIQAFLTQLAARTGVHTIHIIAHSMGNRVVMKALATMPASDSAHSFRVRELALMAPDIDAAEFRRLATALKSSADRVTLYASSGDAALKASATLAGYSRAGEGGVHTVVMPGVVDTIDCSAVDTSLLGLGHSYYADNGTILSDLFRLIRGDSVRDRFRLTPLHNSQGDYWAFVAAAR